MHARSLCYFWMFFGTFPELLIMHAFILFALLALLAIDSPAQGLSRVSMDKGQRFVAAFAPFIHEASERPLKRSLELIATCEYEANVRFRSIDSTGASSVDTTLRLVPRRLSGTKTSLGGMVAFSVDPSMLVSQSKRKAKVAFEVTSDVPITLTTRRSWAGGGEEAHVFPVDHLGTDYRVLSNPTDVYGFRSYTWTPGFVAVIGTEDGTQVTLTSLLSLIDPTTSQQLSSNMPHTFTVNAGEVMMFDHAMDTSKAHSAAQDLSGTLVKSSKPIGVLSGHLKGAVGTRYRSVPPGGLFETGAHFLRNNLVEMMPPTTMADTMFVLSPLMFPYPRVKDTVHDCMIPGDVVKLVGTQSNTLIYKQRTGESTSKLLGTIQAGQVLTDSSLFEEALYWCSKPVIVGQYLRSWAKILPISIGKDGSTGVQGHPSVEAAMPSLTTAVPESRWVTSAVWAKVPGVDNYWMLVFRTGDEGSITWNGRLLSSMKSIREIVNTPYSAVRSSADTSSIQIIQATKNDVRFNVMVYSGITGLQMSSAMSHPTGFDFAAPGRDSIVISEGMVPLNSASCGVREASATINGPNGIASVFPTDRNNFQLVLNNFRSGDKSVSFRVEPIDPSKSGSITVRITAGSGAIAERTYSYTPAALKVVSSKPPSSIGVRVSECFTITITNPGADQLVIKDVSLATQGTFELKTALPITLDSGAMATVTCCVTPTKVGSSKDTIIITLPCYTAPMGEIAYNVSSPLIGVDDIDFGRVDPSSQTITRSVQISNRSGIAKMLVSDIRWAENGSDRRFGFDTTGLGLPFILASGRSITLPITYNPGGDVGNHTATIRVFSSSDGLDSLIRCKALSEVVSSVANDHSAINLHPVPVPIGGILHATLPPGASVWILDMQGRELEQFTVQANGQLNVLVSADRYSAGVYQLVVRTGQQIQTMRWIAK